MAQLQIVIALDQVTGQCSVSGPIDNVFLAYGLLEMAKDVIRNYSAEKAKQSGLVAVHGQLPGSS